MLLLSICIPSYNRFTSLNVAVKLMLKAESRDFEIIILDNKSPNDIEKEIIIHDKRLHFIKQESAVNANENIRDCLLYATGKYAMICLDKDSINGRMLDEFLQVIRQNPKICGGCCIQNKISKENKIEIYDHDQILKFGYLYLGKHPSGDFYRTEYMNEDIKLLSEKALNSGFISDLILARCASHGSMLFYDKPLVFLEKSKTAAKIKSYTYSGKNNNVYFYPNKRKEQFSVYIDHMKSLYITHKLWKKLLEKIYVQKIIQVTFGFRDVMRLKDACTHYDLTVRNITLKEMFHYWIDFNNYFLKSDLNDLSKYSKLYIIIKSNLMLVKKFIDKKLCYSSCRRNVFMNKLLIGKNSIR
ncbi:MAG: glycosyltransferase [Veillonellales bacterium]